jgi:hypothetical protein
VSAENKANAVATKTLWNLDFDTLSDESTEFAKAHGLRIAPKASSPATAR